MYRPPCRGVCRPCLLLVLFLVLWAAVAGYWYREYLNRSGAETALREATRRFPDRVASVRRRGGDLPILIPVYSRPEYLAAVLAGLRAAAGVSERALVFVSQDGDNAAVAALLAEAQRGPRPLRLVHMRHTRPFLGALAAFLRLLPARLWRTDYATAANVRYLLAFAYETLRADAAILLESDLEPSYDMYTYFRWANTHLVRTPADSERVLTVGAFGIDRAGLDVATTAAPPATPGPPKLYALAARPFGVWGWMARREQWPVLRDGWTRFQDWDFFVQRAREAAGLVCLQPRLSRVRNIGMQGINFNVQPSEAAKWTGVRLPGPNLAYAYNGTAPRIDWARFGS